MAASNRSFWQKHRGKIAGIYTYLILASGGGWLIPALGISVAFTFPFIAALVGFAVVSFFAALIVGKIVSACCSDSSNEHAPTNSSTRRVLQASELTTNTAPTSASKPSSPRIRINTNNSDLSQYSVKFEHRQIFDAIFACKELCTTICSIQLRTGGSIDVGNGFELLDKLLVRGTLATIDDLNKFLNEYNLKGLINIYLTPPQGNSKPIFDIYDETENKVKSLFEKIGQGSDVEILKSKIKCDIKSNNWRIFLHQLINEGTVKIGDEAEQSARELFTRCGLEKYLPAQPVIEALKSVEIQLSDAALIPPQEQPSTPSLKPGS